MLWPKKKGYNLAREEMGLSPSRACKKKEAPSATTTPSKLPETQAAAHNKKHAEDTSH